MTKPKLEEREDLVKLIKAHIPFYRFTDLSGYSTDELIKIIGRKLKK